MIEQRTVPPQSLVVRGDQGLGGIPVTEDGQDVVYSFIEDTLPTAIPSATIQDALSLAGTWSDLDWDEALEALDRIRHESVPTPPIDLDLFVAMISFEDCCVKFSPTFSPTLSLNVTPTFAASYDLHMVQD